MAHDYHLAEYLRDRISLLAPDEKRDLDDCLDQLLANPAPDGKTRVSPPPYFPFRQGSIIAQCGRFRIGYELANQGMVLHVFSISPLPELPKEEA